MLPLLWWLVLRRPRLELPELPELPLRVLQLLLERVKPLSWRPATCWRPGAHLHPTTGLSRDGRPVASLRRNE
ncbi:hypothetical protein TCAP_04814 [Tolypocladium capitatum]|uniref:Uncharacterized protein n=1 Tax=Tolypocladium capitatum TaxID=45235 RepID=A0A2K3QCG1_9HYPO|nr:hypothetical protein TCAP_04814 [Tolypocladium capitatum]